MFLEEIERLLKGVLVLVELPIREVMLVLILLFVLLVDRFVIVFRPLLFWLLVLLEEVERLLDGVLVLIELPIRDVMLELILPLELLLLLELGVDVRELIDRLEVLLLGLRFVIILLELLLDDLLVTALLEVLLLVLGALLVMALLELLLLLGVLLVMALLEVLLLGVRLLIDLLDVLLLGARLVTLLLELLLLLGALLVTLLLELRLDDDLDEDLAAGADLEACRLELRDLLLLDRVLAAITGSQNNKSANKVQKTRKSEPSRRDSTTLIFDL